MNRSVFPIVWLLTAVAMVGHILGLFLGWWGIESTLYWVVLALLVVQGFLLIAEGAE